MSDDLSARIRAIQQDEKAVVDEPPEEPTPPVSVDKPADVSSAALSLADAMLGGAPTPIPETTFSAQFRVSGQMLLLSEGDSAVIGRGAEADVTIADARVSRRHIVVEMSQGRATVVDVGSRNGTEIRRAGTRLFVGASPELLEDGDSIGTVDDLEIAQVRIVEG